MVSINVEDRDVGVGLVSGQWRTSNVGYTENPNGAGLDDSALVGQERGSARRQVGSSIRQVA